MSLGRSWSSSTTTTSEPSQRRRRRISKGRRAHIEGSRGSAHFSCLHMHATDGRTARGVNDISSSRLLSMKGSGRAPASVRSRRNTHKHKWRVQRGHPASVKGLKGSLLRILSDGIGENDGDDGTEEGSSSQSSGHCPSPCHDGSLLGAICQDCPVAKPLIAPSGHQSSKGADAHASWPCEELPSCRLRPKVARRVLTKTLLMQHNKALSASGHHADYSAYPSFLSVPNPALPMGRASAASAIDCGSPHQTSLDSQDDDIAAEQALPPSRVDPPRPMGASHRGDAPRSVQTCGMDPTPSGRSKRQRGQEPTSAPSPPKPDSRHRPPWTRPSAGNSAGEGCATVVLGGRTSGAAQHRPCRQLSAPAGPRTNRSYAGRRSKSAGNYSASGFFGAEFPFERYCHSFPVSIRNEYSPSSGGRNSAVFSSYNPAWSNPVSHYPSGSPQGASNVHVLNERPCAPPSSPVIPPRRLRSHSSASQRLPSSLAVVSDPARRRDAGPLLEFLNSFFERSLPGRAIDSGIQSDGAEPPAGFQMSPLAAFHQSRRRHSANSSDYPNDNNHGSTNNTDADGSSHGQIAMASYQGLNGTIDEAPESSPLNLVICEEQVRTDPPNVKDKSRKAMLPTVLFDAKRRGLMPPENAKCSICLDEFQHLDKRSFLPCLHSYHKDCIGRWLHQSSVCPVCLLDIRKLLRLAKMRREAFSSKDDSLCSLAGYLELAPNGVARIRQTPGMDVGRTSSVVVNPAETDATQSRLSNDLQSRPPAVRSLELLNVSFGAHVERHTRARRALPPVSPIASFGPTSCRERSLTRHPPVDDRNVPRSAGGGSYGDSNCSGMPVLSWQSAGEPNPGARRMIAPSLLADSRQGIASSFLPLPVTRPPTPGANALASQTMRRPSALASTPVISSNNASAGQGTRGTRSVRSPRQGDGVAALVTDQPRGRVGACSATVRLIENQNTRHASPLPSHGISTRETLPVTDHSRRRRGYIRPSTGGDSAPPVRATAARPTSKHVTRRTNRASIPIPSYATAQEAPTNQGHAPSASATGSNPQTPFATRQARGLPISPSLLPGPTIVSPAISTVRYPASSHSSVLGGALRRPHHMGLYGVIRNSVGGTPNQRNPESVVTANHAAAFSALSRFTREGLPTAGRSAAMSPRNSGTNPYSSNSHRIVPSQLRGVVGDMAYS